MKRETKQHVYRGLRLGFGAVAGICTLILLTYGINKLRFPEIDNDVFTVLKGYPPRLVGAVCVVVAVSVVVTTVNYWAKMLSGLFAYGAFGGVLALFKGGFHSDIASLQLTRLEVAILTAMFGGCAALTWRLSEGELNRVDRLAVLATPFLLLWGMTSYFAATVFKALSAVLIIFGLAAVYERIQHRHKSRH